MSVLVRNQGALSELKVKFPEAFFCIGDIKNKVACERWVNETLKRWNRIDNLINNAAMTGPTGKLEELNFSDFEETLQVNFLAPIFLTQLVLPCFQLQKKGTVINLSGGGATAPRPFFGAYGASKCALVRFTESLALEYPEFNFYSIAPGALKTPMMEGISKTSADKIGKEQDEAIHRMKYGGDDPKKAAQLILWLCQNQPRILSGKLISAKWDNYLEYSLNNPNIPYWTLRRVDEALIKTLSKTDGPHSC